MHEHYSTNSPSASPASASRRTALQGLAVAAVGLASPAIAAPRSRQADGGTLASPVLIALINAYWPAKARSDMIDALVPPEAYAPSRPPAGTEARQRWNTLHANSLADEAEDACDAMYVIHDGIIRFPCQSHADVQAKLAFVEAAWDYDGDMLWTGDLLRSLRL